MPYTTTSDILTLLSPSQLAQALDDNGSGSVLDSSGNLSVEAQALLSQIISTSSNAVDSRVSSIYTVPFSAPPAKIRDAALIFTCESLTFRRLPPGIENPFTRRADEMRKELTKIGHGELDLDAATPRAFYPGNAILEANKLQGSTL